MTSPLFSSEILRKPPIPQPVESDRYADEATAAAGSRLGPVREKLRACLLLTKPKIAALVTFTGLAALIHEGSLLAAPPRLAGVLIGIFLSAGAANGLNQIWERDLDARMARTRSRRPIPAGRIGVQGALFFCAGCGLLGVFLLKAAGSMLSALLGAATIAFYVGIYTVGLKRRTPMNIVIGGAAGAAAPLIGWAAGANGLSTVPLLMFLLIFLWSPPHFWGLAIWKKEEYAQVNLPMLPVVAGEKKTCMQIMVYTAFLPPVTALLGVCADLGWIFLLGTLLLGMDLIHRAIRLARRMDPQSARAFFRYSIVYLSAVFALAAVLGIWRG